MRKKIGTQCGVFQGKKKHMGKREGLPSARVMMENIKSGRELEYVELKKD